MTIRFSLAVAAAGLLCACQPPTPANDPSADSDPAHLVARYDGHEISVEEVDARILALPRSERPKPGADLDVWFEQQTRELAMDNLLRADARETGVVDDQEFLGARLDIETRIGMQLCMLSLHPDAERIDPAEIQAGYDAARDEFSQPERRSVSYIYKRLSPDRSANAARAEVEALRKRVLGGESFSYLAAKNSDSETRHNEGSLGWLTRGELPKSLDDAVFSIEEGVPSVPLVTREGVHLFYVQKILPAGTRPLREVRSVIRNRILAERRAQAMTELEGEAGSPPDSFELDQKSFEKAMDAGDPKALLLRIGGRQLTAGGLRVLLAQIAAQNPGKDLNSPGERSWKAYQAARRRILVYEHCRSEGRIPADELARRVGDWESKATLRLIRQRRLLELAGSDEKKIRSFYESNIGQFSSAPKWRLKHLSIPTGPDTPKVMAELEKVAAAGGTDIQMLASRYGGTIDEWDPDDLVALGKRDVRLVTLVSPLAVGKLSAPYRTRNALELVQLMELEVAKAKPFDQVRVQVVAAYVNQYTSEVYRQLADRMLTAAHFEIAPKGLARLQAMGLSQAEVTVEELESMIEQL